MTSPAGSPAKLPGYDLAAPVESEAVAALERVFGSARGRAIWADACGLAGVPVGRAGGGPLLERALESLGSQGGAAATVARSIGIRMRTYTQLAARRASANAGVRP